MNRLRLVAALCVLFATRTAGADLVLSVDSENKIGPSSLDTYSYVSSGSFPSNIGPGAVGAGTGFIQPWLTETFIRIDPSQLGRGGVAFSGSIDRLRREPGQFGSEGTYAGD